MLVKELRKEIEKYDKKELSDIIVELYKKIPKSKKEDYDIDNYIKDITSKEKPKRGKVLTIDELKEEINTFIYYVDNDYYASGNKVISKKERSTWRFKVKRYYKELNKYSPDTDDGRIATFLLIELFKRVSLGSCYLKFSNWETFRAIGISQGEYYDTIIKRILANGYVKDNLEKSIDLLNVEKDPYGWSNDMMDVFISSLKTIDTKYLSIDILKNKVNDIKNKIAINKRDRDYELEEQHNRFIEGIVQLYFILNEVEEGVRYFHKNYTYYDKEIKEYVLLNIMDDYELYKEWVLEYEAHLKKIDYRDSLKERYKEIKKIINKK